MRNSSNHVKFIKLCSRNWITFSILCSHLCCPRWHPSLPRYSRFALVCKIQAWSGSSLICWKRPRMERASWTGILNNHGLQMYVELTSCCFCAARWVIPNYESKGQETIEKLQWESNDNCTSNLSSGSALQLDFVICKDRSNTYHQHFHSSPLCLILQEPLMTTFSTTFCVSAGNSALLLVEAIEINAS